MNQKSKMAVFIGGIVIASGIYIGNMYHKYHPPQNDKYVLLSPLPESRPVGEYNTENEAWKEGARRFGNDSYDVKKKGSDIERKTYKSAHQLRRLRQSKIRFPKELEEFMFKCLPGKTLKENILKGIDEERNFNGRSYGDYITGIQDGYTFYDLDKDGSDDVAAKFDYGGYSSAQEVITSEILTHRVKSNAGVIGEIGTLYRVVYTDINRDEILEKRVEFIYDKSSNLPRSISAEGLSEY